MKQEVTGITDYNGCMIYVGNMVNLFGMIGEVKFEAGAYGIGFNEIDWDLVKRKIPEITECDNTPYFCENDNFISFWELIWNFNCESNCCYVVELVQEA